VKIYFLSRNPKTKRTRVPKRKKKTKTMCLTASGVFAQSISISTPTHIKHVHTGQDIEHRTVTNSYLFISTFEER